MTADLLLDHGAGRLARPEARDAHTRRELAVGLFDRLIVALRLYLNLEKDLTLW